MISSGVTTVLPPFQTISVEIFSALIIRGGNLIINNGARLTITGTLSVDPAGYLNLIDNDVIISNDIDISIVGPGTLNINNGGSLSVGPSAHLQLISGMLNINNGGVVGIDLGEPQDRILRCHAQH